MFFLEDNKNTIFCYHYWDSMRNILTWYSTSRFWRCKILSLWGWSFEISRSFKVIVFSGTSGKTWPWPKWCDAMSLKDHCCHFLELLFVILNLSKKKQNSKDPTIFLYTSCLETYLLKRSEYRSNCFSYFCQ